MAQKKPGRKGGRTRTVVLKPWAKILALILIFPFAALLLPTTLVFTTMMAPTWVAYVTDRSKERHLALTVGFLNLSGTLPAIIDLWSMGQSHDAAMMLIGDVFVWVVAYGAAMVGWVLFAVMPTFVAGYFKMTTENRIKGLARQQKTLIDEWGHAVAEDIGVMPIDPVQEDDEADEGEPQPEVTEAELVQSAQRQ